MTTWSGVLLSVHMAATSAMVGLIWFVQVVHYPLFDAVGPADFVAYEVAHRRRTSWVVGPLMGIEAVAALVLVAAPGRLGTAIPFAGLALLAVIHASTVSLQVPRHTDLAARYDPAVTRRLVATNWIRTIGWSGRAILAVAMIMVAVPS